MDGQESQNFSCYYEGTRDQPFPGRVRSVDGSEGSYDPVPGVNIGTGTAMGTTRILLSYDRAFTRNILAGVRVGYALFGGPPSGADATYEANTHAELRVTYVFRKNGITSKGFRPYVHLGGGLAQVDAKVTVPIQDCSILLTEPERQACSTGEYEGEPPEEQNLDGWKKLGKQFITGGGGVIYGLGERLGLQLNLNLMYMLPSTGLVLEPSLGLTFGL
jgi:hypothetical protein